MSDSPSSTPDLYAQCIANGCTPRLAEMLAAGRPPQSKTDAEFLKGHCDGSQFEKQPHIGDRYKKEAERHGLSTKGKVYLGGLATYPGDPRAWVSGRGDVQRVCEDRGWHCEGDVNVKHRDEEPKPPPPPPATALKLTGPVLKEE